MGFEVEYDLGKIAILTTNVAQDLAEKGANSARARAARLAPKRTGALAASIRVELIGVAGPETAYRIVSDLDYAWYQEFGTGPIVPRTAKVLRFSPKGGGVVFAMRTSGVPATHFMARAGALITAADFR